MAFWFWEFLQTAAIVYVVWRMVGVQYKTISLLMDRYLQLQRRQ